MTQKFYAVDDALYREDGRKLGQMTREARPSTQTLFHAMCQLPPEGEFARLTGTLFVFNSPTNGAVIYVVR